MTNLTYDEYFTSVRSDEINPLSSRHYGYYNLLADAFLSRRLSLLLKPVPELLYLADPYDPIANSTLRLHDASLYQGRYYLYFGPVPALALFIPFRLLQLGKISEPLAVALFGFGSFVCSVVILIRIAKRFTQRVSKPLLLIALLAVGICNAMPFLLRRPIIYEVAIAAGAFFIMLGLAFIVGECVGSKLSRRSMAFLSLSWGLSVGCRPQYILAGVALFALWIFFVVSQNDRSWKTAFGDALFLSLPFASCLLSLGVYNFLRFNSWTEFGVKYQLAGAVSRPETMFRGGNLLAGLYLNILRSPQLDFNFPFIHLQIGSPISLPDNYNSHEPIAGFLLTSPIVALLAAILIPRVCSGVRAWIGLLGVVGVSALCIDAFLIPGSSMRYQVDFIFPILCAAFLLWLWLDSAVEGHWASIGFRCLCLVLVFTSCICHMAFGMTGYYDLFKRSNPRTYFVLEDFFRPVATLLVGVSSPAAPAVLDTISPAGGATTLNDTPFQLSGKDLIVRFFSPTARAYRVSGDFAPNVAVVNPSSITLRVRAANSSPVDCVIREGTHLEWTLPAGRGVYRIAFSGIAVEQYPAVAEGLPSFTVANMRLVDEVTGLAVR